MTLYEIDSELAALMDTVDPETGEWVGDPEAWASLNMEREKKIENTALLIKNLEADADSIKVEEFRLKQRRERLEKKAGWLRDNLFQSLAGEPFETPRCLIRFRKNPESVRLTDEAAAMSWAVEYRQDVIKFGKPTLSKTALKDLLKTGEAVPGAELVRETRMEVK